MALSQLHLRVDTGQKWANLYRRPTGDVSADRLVILRSEYVYVGYLGWGV